MVAFSTTTWDGWDYMPRAWPRWLDDPDGVMLVGLVGGQGGLDVDKREIEPGTVVAVVRVAFPAQGEVWLEGIRVDPRVRNMSVASDLQVAELHWAAANGATVIRYATSARNEGSIRLGAHGGFEPLVSLLAASWQPEGSVSDGRDESAFLPEVQEQARQRRRALLDALAAQGDVADASEADALWALVDEDATFNHMARLYEPRPWALEELTERKFREHVRIGEVIRLADSSSGQALAIVVADVAPAEDRQIRLATLAGAPLAAFDLVERARRAATATIRFRYPVGPSLVEAARQLYIDAGYEMSDWTLRILSRTVDASHRVPSVDPESVILEDAPQAEVAPPR